MALHRRSHSSVICQGESPVYIRVRQKCNTNYGLVEARGLYYLIQDLMTKCSDLIFLLSSHIVILFRFEINNKYNGHSKS